MYIRKYIRLPWNKMVCWNHTYSSSFRWSLKSGWLDSCGGRLNGDSTGDSLSTHGFKKRVVPQLSSSANEVIRSTLAPTVYSLRTALTILYGVGLLENLIFSKTLNSSILAD